MVATLKLTINIDREVHRRLKVKTATEGTTITSVLVKAIEDYLHESKKGTPKPTTTRKTKG